MNTVLTSLSLHRSTIIGFMLLGLLFGFLYRRIMKVIFKTSTRGVTRNIDKSGRRMRAVGGIALLIGAIATTMSPILLFFAGFCFFEAIFSRCGLYAALGKNSCPLIDYRDD